MPTILKALTWSKSVNYAQTNKTDLHFELFFVIIYKIKKKGELPSSLNLSMYETVYAQIKEEFSLYMCI